MVFEKLRSMWGETGAAEDRQRGYLTAGVSPGGEAGAATETAPVSTLFFCPDCDAVYIAKEKDTCSRCRGDVREVSPTLSSN